MGKVLSINISEKKGTVKKPCGSAQVRMDGIVNDAHSGDWHRQISLLDFESIKWMQDKGIDVNIGEFAENITTKGIELTKVKIGDLIRVGDVEIEVTQIGKECHDECEIKKKVGKCIMPKRGIFGKILKEGFIKEEDNIILCPLINVGVLTLSDKGSKGNREDKSGQLIKEMIKSINGVVKEYEILPDDKNSIKTKLQNWCNNEIDLIITTGGTGLTPRDVTPDATAEVIEKQVPGIAEIIRSEGYKKAKNAILTRGVCGFKNKTLIINLPGSTKAVSESLDSIINVIPHAVQTIKGETQECGGLQIK